MRMPSKSECLRVLLPLTLLLLRPPGMAGAADLNNGYNEFFLRCAGCHGGTPAGTWAAASLLQVQGRAEGLLSHGGSTAPFIGLNLEDLAAYVSSGLPGGYSISGSVLDLKGAGVPGVAVQISSTYLTASLPAPVTTSSDGSYSITNLAPGDYSISAVVGGDSFYPLQRSVTVLSWPGDALGQNFGLTGLGGAVMPNLDLYVPDQYVSPQGYDWNVGTSWEAAKSTIAAALAATPLGGKIWVATGTYTEVITLRGRELHGGFAGTEWVINQRDLFAHPTVLEEDPNILTPLGITPGSAVTLGTENSREAVLDGVTVVNSQAPGPGGAVFVEASAAPRITRCTFAQNQGYQGGGIFCSQGASPFILNNVIASNSATAGGGGIYCDYGSTPQLVANNLILGNSSIDGGGGFACNGAAFLVANNTVVGNQAFFSGAGGLHYLDGTGTNFNNIVAYNSSGIEIDNAAMAAADYNCVYANNDFDYYLLSPGPHDVPHDPAFADLANFDLHLTPASPCVDVGESRVLFGLAADLDGRPRLSRGGLDLGAYELPPPTLVCTVRGRTIMLSWAANETTFVAQYTTNFASGAWGSLNLPLVTDGLLQTLTLSNAPPTCLFRLKE